MDDFLDGKIYLLANRNTRKSLYIGSTTKSLDERMKGHIWSFYSDNTKNTPIYVLWRVLGQDEVVIELIESWPCKTKEELFEREGYWQQRYNPFCNVRQAGRSVEQWHQEHKEYVSAQRRVYREQNKKVISQKAREFREKNEEKIKLEKKVYYESNRGKILEKSKQYYLEHKHERNQKGKEYYEKNKEHLMLKNKEWANRNPEQRKMAKKKYYEANKDKMNKLQKTKVECLLCGTQSSRGNFSSRHRKTKSHLAKLKVKLEQEPNYVDTFKPLSM